MAMFFMVSNFPVIYCIALAADLCQNVFTGV